MKLSKNKYWISVLVLLLVLVSLSFAIIESTAESQEYSLSISVGDELRYKVTILNEDLSPVTFSEREGQESLYNITTISEYVEYWLIRSDYTYKISTSPSKSYVYKKGFMVSKDPAKYCLPYAALTYICPLPVHEYLTSLKDNCLNPIVTEVTSATIATFEQEGETECQQKYAYDPSNGVLTLFQWSIRSTGEIFFEKRLLGGIIGSKYDLYPFSVSLILAFSALVLYIRKKITLRC